MRKERAFENGPMQNCGQAEVDPLLFPERGLKLLMKYFRHSSDI
jgi:hypothetical protein